MNKENIIIIGSSGHASVAVDIIHRQDIYKIVGLVDSLVAKGTKALGYTVLGNENDLPVLKQQFGFEKCFIAIGDNNIRFRMYKRIESLNISLKYVTLIHNSASVANDSIIGDGCILVAGSIVNSGACIDDFCILNTKASLGHDGKMGKFSSLAPGVTVGGNVNIGFKTFISLGANVLNNISIGSNCIVGAGSLILNDIENDSIVYGVPAKFIKKNHIN